MNIHVKCLLTVLCLRILSGPLSSHAATVNVSIAGFAFSPATVTIKVDDAVMWKNMDAALFCI